MEEFDDIHFEEIKKAQVVGSIDVVVVNRFIKVAAASGMNLSDLLEQAMIRECDYREGTKRYNIKKLMDDNKKKFRDEVNTVLNKAGILKPEWD